MLRNLLQCEGYEEIEAIRGEDRGEGIALSILTLLKGRGLEVDAAAHDPVLACQDREQLDLWLLAAARVDSTNPIFD